MITPDIHADDEQQAAALPTVADYATKIASYWTLPLPGAARPRTQKELDAALEAHRTWVQSTQEPGAPMRGRRAVLSGADLRGLNLARRDLRGADLSGANLEGASLAGSDLRRAVLDGACLKNADLRGAKLVNATLDGAVLDGADLNGALMRR